MNKPTAATATGSKVGALYSAPTEMQLAAAADWVQRFAERWAKPVPERFRDLMHADTKNLYPPMTTPANAEGVIQWFRDTLARLPDLRLEVVRWAPCGDHVLIEWSASASIGERTFTWQGVDRFTLKGERCIEGRVYYDTQLLRDTIEIASAKPRVT